MQTEILRSSLYNSSFPQDFNHNDSDPGNHTEGEQNAVERDSAPGADHVQHVYKQCCIQTEYDQQAVAAADQLFDRSGPDQEGKRDERQTEQAGTGRDDPELP